MLLATNTTGQQQLGKSPTLSLNTTPCLPSGSACAKTNTTSSNNKASASPNNLAIMSSSLDVSAPSATTTISPTNNNLNANGNNLKCSNNNNTSQKYEAQYGANVSSPCNSDGNNSQNIDESKGNNKNKAKHSNGVNLAAMDSTSRGERDSLSNISSNSLIRQSSASTNSCSVQFNESSPNNGDSSSSSSNASHMNNDNNKSNDEEKLNNNQTIKNNTVIKEDERDKSNSSSSTTSSSSGNVPTNTSLSNQTSLSNIKVGLPATDIVKDEKDMVKKEESSLSPPNMSPVGFGSIVGTQINECSDNPSSSTNKSNDSSSSCDKRMALSGNVCNENDESSVTQSVGSLIVPGSGTNLNLISSCNTLNTNTNPLTSKSLDGFCSDASTSTPMGSNIPNTSCNIPLNASFIINNLSSTNGPPQVGGGGTNIISGGGSGINNCMEYMQQQNHIFVFSTQLANKGAEAVLAGQFPTIIAYHCTQPATKSFFEDFFLKNPMKMTKLQRQNTLNIMGGLPPAGGPGSGGQPPWLTGNCNSMGKMSHKLALNKSETITSSSTNSSGIGVLNENDMMCWDQTRSVMESPAGDSANTMKMLENSENSSNTAKPICSGLTNDDSIPSLQGVKVPDENLTPQQRQHREEQLAKLKKMNQFLFPENGGNDFHTQASGNNPMMGGKMQVPPEALANAMPGNTVALLNMQGTNMGNKLNAAAMRNISGNLMNHSKTGASNSQLENMPNLVEDIIMPADMMASCGPNEMTTTTMNPLKQGCMPNMNIPGGLGNGGRGLMNASGPNLNMMNNSGPIGMPPGSLMNDPNNTMMGNSSDVMSPFNSNHCPSTGQDGGGGGMMGPHKNMNAPPPHPSDMNSSVGMPQMEWSKLHHHIYEERLKNNHSNANNMPPEIGGGGGGGSGCQQTLTRCNSTGVGGGAGGMSHRTNTNVNASNRGTQGPPPPYHPTQRSASVPIATQSPNPSSPNNPTSNMSLPSPRASNTMGGALSSTTSPSMDITTASSASTANTNSTTTTAAGCASGGNGSTNKNTFTQQGSPTPASGAGNSNRNRSSVNNLNSNPTTPLSHVSPKDIDSKNMNITPTPDHKSTRPNSQRSRSPLLNDVPNNNTMEPRFPSPGLNFTPSGTSGANTQNLSNSFKNQNSNLERQNLQQMPPQFCRRTDNMPLNPNSNRSNQTKMSNAFDPITSLAQMSQQLTGGGVGLNSGGVGNSPNNMSGLMVGPGGVNDINMNGLMGGPMMGGPVDPSMDHCNQNPNGGGGNMGMSGLGGVPGSVQGPFGPGNCNMMGGNPGPICQRLLNPKMCGPNLSGGFNPNQVGGMCMRDGPSGFPGMMPSHRIMNHRMSANFGNFNVSPNIQVKASTPNTIQYMPVRPQNNNNNNMRVPPSLEFLQRYANPQIMGNSGGGGGPVAGPGASPSDMPAMNGPSDLNKMPNTNNNMGVNPNAMNQMNFFGNCNQMSAMGGMGQPGGGDQDELQGGVGMMSNHDPMNIPGPHAPMLRGMRPMRQGGLQSGVGMNSGSRMQHPGVGNIPPNGLGNNPFPGNDSESLDCNDPTNGMFNNAAAAAGLYQQKNNKPPPMGMSHGSPNINPNNGNNGPLPNNNVINDQNPSSNPIQNSVMMGPNNSMLNSNIPNSNNGVPGGPLSGPANMGYKAFVGPTSNDLKYAQQYHSFQQQLYATSTRNQQPGGQQQPPNAMSPNNNPNAGFFVNK
ncbi:protein BCL9 homolog isoform X2 [Calliphora vicina]|uniref:protein BCL9 homolog isoform X2 n=1 Tax=Calliphora vicina TaxID=7373 RepID=UPI00325BC804